MVTRSSSTLRFQFVYLPLLLVNMVVLPLALAYTPLNAYAVQALFAMVTVVAGYLGNKHFAFRRSGHRSRQGRRGYRVRAMPATERPLVSVVLPSLDQAGYLPRVLRSVVDQRGAFAIEWIAACRWHPGSKTGRSCSRSEWESA